MILQGAICSPECWVTQLPQPVHWVRRSLGLRTQMYIETITTTRHATPLNVCKVRGVSCSLRTVPRASRRSKAWNGDVGWLGMQWCAEYTFYTLHTRAYCGALVNDSTGVRANVRVLCIRWTNTSASHSTHFAPQSISQPLWIHIECASNFLTLDCRGDSGGVRFHLGSFSGRQYGVKCETERSNRSEIRYCVFCNSFSKVFANTPR